MNNLTRNKLLEILRSDLNIPDSVGLCVKLDAHFDIQVKVPELDHDKMMKERHGTVVHTRGVNERRVVFDLFMHLYDKGFRIVDVDDGEEVVVVARAPDGSELDAITQIKAAMETMFGVDECMVCVKHRGHTKQHCIKFVFGNADDGSEVIADWSLNDDRDVDGFNVEMDEFTTKLWDN